MKSLSLDLIFNNITQRPISIVDVTGHFNLTKPFTISALMDGGLVPDVTEILKQRIENDVSQGDPTAMEAYEADQVKMIISSIPLTKS